MKHDFKEDLFGKLINMIKPLYMAYYELNDDHNHLIDIKTG